MEDINALDEIHKGACMGQDALSITIDKVKVNYTPKNGHHKKNIFPILWV